MPSLVHGPCLDALTDLNLMLGKRQIVWTQAFSQRHKCGVFRWGLKDAHLESGPPEELPDEGLHCAGVHGQCEQQRHGDGRPVMVVNPPRPDAAPIHLNAKFSSQCTATKHASACLHQAHMLLPGSTYATLRTFSRRAMAV